MKLEQHLNERNRRDLGIVWFIIGLIILISGFSGGLAFFVLGTVWLLTASGSGLEWARANPNMMKTSLLSATVALILLALYFLTLTIIQ